MKVNKKKTFPENQDSEALQPEAEAKEKVAAVSLAPCDTAIYHNEHEPRSIRQGEEIPEGWTMEPGKLTVKWQNNSDGSWFKIPV
jgi:hypothetical protein